MSQIKYPIGIQSFENIRTGGYLYIDKTSFVQKLVSENQYYFLSRPRRFGKSLLLSTIEAFFKGRRKLFRGLAIDSMDWDWEEYPVLHLDLNAEAYSVSGALEILLEAQMKKWENDNDISEAKGSISFRFRGVIEKMHEKYGKKVVILIDEYDKPLLDTLHDNELNTNNRNTLQAFYSVMKTMDPHIRFVMLTGVSRFGKVSVFSGLNNLQDISLDVDFNSICGISETELSDNFKQGVSDMSKKLDVSDLRLKELLKENFDGYHFAKSGEDIYNPFSLMNTFQKKDIQFYWFNTGTPTFLIHLLENGNFTLPEMSGYHCDPSLLTGSDVYLNDPIPIFYQSGYLTIKGYDPEFNEYILGFPNREVSEGFSKFLINSYMRKGSSPFHINEFIRDVRSGNPKGFMERLQSFLAGIPYDHIQGSKEAHFVNIVYVVFKLMGFYVQTEFRTSDGRIDMVVETKDYVYVFEFKLKGTAATAMKQINEKEYALPFINSGKKIYKIGAAFSQRTNRLSRFIIEEV